MKESRVFKSVVVAAICLASTLLVYAWTGTFKPFVKWENDAINFRLTHGRVTPVNTNIAFIGIDKPSYSGDFFDEAYLKKQTPDDQYFMQLLRGNYPWTREIWAALIEKVMGAGAKGVILDIVFATEGVGDAEFKAAIKKYSPNVVIGCAIEENVEQVSFATPNASIIDPDDFGSTLEDLHVGFVTIDREPDGKVKRGRYVFTMADIYRKLLPPAMADQVGGDDVILKSLSARAIDALGLGANLPPLSHQPLIRYTGPPNEMFKQISLKRLFDPREWESQFDSGKFFKDKIVLVGPTANLFHDIHPTPWDYPHESMMLGPEIHINFLNAAIHNEFISETNPETDKLIVACSGIVVILLGLGIVRPGFRFLLGVLLSMGYLWYLLRLYDNENLMVGAAVTPVLLINSNSVILLIYEYVLEKVGRMKLKMTMNFYFSPKVLDEVLKNPGSTDAQAAEVTLLLTDLRNSTPLAEQLGPQGMFTLLNQIFEAQTEEIMEEEGSLEHFLGDQFLSYWGAPQPQPDGTNQALRAARRLIIAMEEVKKKQKPEVFKLFGYGVAIHCGSVLFGNKGSAKRMDFGLVGDSVNEAARIEALTKYYGIQLLISQEAFDNIDDPGRYRLVDRTIVKGKSEPVVLYELECCKTIAEFDQLKKDYDEAFMIYGEGRFEEALPLFQKLIDTYDDGPSKQMIERCRSLIEEPNPDWKGVWKMESK